MKIIIIGPYPPPYGGISVHIKRMKEYLESNKVNVIIYNESKLGNHKMKNTIPIRYRKLIFKIPFLKADIINFHSIDKRVRILLGFYKTFNNKIILSLHGESMNDQINESNFVVKKLLYRSLNKIDIITCSNIKIKNDLVDFGIKSNKIEVIPEYIRPNVKKEDRESYNPIIYEFITNSKFLISANGWIRFYKGQDLYGIDMLIDLIYKLKLLNVNVSLILALIGVESQSIREKEYYNRLKEKINELNVEKNIFIFESKDSEFYPILSQSHLFIRPTNTDGNSVSVMEALDFKIPCIVSDVCPRPKETILFKTRDINDLTNQVINVINNYNEFKQKLNLLKLENNADKLFDIYKRLIL